MTSRRVALLPVALILSIGICTPHLFAQGTDLGTIRGTVTDSGGAVIPNAQIEIMDLSTRVVHKVTTNSHGNYEASALQPGRYKATIAASGFGTSVTNGIALSGTDSVSANAALRASTDTTVQVSSEASTIDTEDPTISETIGSRAIIELPRDSRDIYSFLYINPNISQSSEPGTFKFTGAQSYGASFSLDGQRSNGGIFGDATASKPSLEAVGELNVLSNGFSAEYAGIANIRVTTKRGGADYHGSVFYNNKNSALAAWTLAAKSAQANFAPTAFQSHYPNPFFNVTDVGASFGGPILKLKNTWFFASYEHNWTVSPSTEASNNMPHPTLLAGDFSLLKNASKPAVPVSVTLTPNEIATDTVGSLGKQFITIPQRLLNPVTAKLISLYYPQIGITAPISSTTGRVPGFSTSVPSQTGLDLGTLRIDHDFSDSNRLYGVYHASASKVAINPVVVPFTGLGLSKTDRLNHTVSLSYTHVFTQNLVNEARGGFNKQGLYTHSNTTLQGFLQSIGFSTADIAAYGAVVGPSQLTTYGHPAISFGSGFTAFGSGGRNTNRPLDQNLATFGDTFTWALGRHSVKMGADLVRNQAVDGFALNRGSPRGGMAYTGAGPTSLTKFLVGQAPDSASYIGFPRPPMDVHNWETGYFVQDDFRVTPRLTLNLGMRYEFFTAFTEQSDLLANFDPNYKNTTTGQLGRFVIPSSKTLKYLDPSIVAFGVVTADQSGLGVGRSLVKSDKTDFAPRVGFAFRITDKSVVRGGYGMYYPTSSAHIFRDPIGTNPFNQGYTKRSGPGAPLQGWPKGGGTTGISPNSGGVVSGFGNTPSANFVPVDLKNPRVHQWNASFEQQLPWQSSVRLSYIGGRETGQVAGYDLDMIPPSNDPFGTTTGDGVTPCDPINNLYCNYSSADNARITFPALGDFVTRFGNFGHSLTTSLQGQVERRATGFTFSVAYTYLDQKSSALDTGNDSLGGNTYNPFQPNSDYGQDGYTSHHRVVAYGIYDLPVGRGQHFAGNSSRLVDALIGGWQTSFNMFAKTGTGFTPFWQCDDCDPVMAGNIASGALDAVGDFGGSTYRPLLTGNPKQKSAGFQWNANAFTVPGIGADLFSNSAVVKRNILIGPSTYGINLGLHKSVHLNDRMSIEIGADIDNVFNHPMLSPDENDGGSNGTFALLGDFNIAVDQTTPPAPGKQPVLLPITPDLVNINPDFGRLYRSYSQEGVDSRRSIRLRGRFTF